ncbi:hypothetical protein ACN20G_25895 [Streptomyces sp. BI20]|uniref:hypothetical protein n=1 Tax=Streptomyces sp. BI20 TaxID=3403460 RepID=UPI003C766902
MAAALAGLRDIRRVLGVSGPAPWEVARPVRAVALLLEAAGLPPADPEAGAPGYRVLAPPAAGPSGPRPTAVAVVEWSGPGPDPDRWDACESALTSMGWVCLRYRGPGRRRHLEVEAPG